MENEQKNHSCVSRTLSIIAITLSAVSILLSSLTLMSRGSMCQNNFRMQRPCGIQSEMRRNMPNVDKGNFNYGGKSFRPNRPDANTNQNGNNQNKQNGNGPTTAPEISPDKQY